MKKKMSITRKLIAFATLFLISCSEDLYEKENTFNNKGVKISKVSLKEPKFQNKTKLIQEVNKIKNKQSLSTNTHRMVYDSINDFYFDDENGTLIENKNGYESYTFKVIREAPIDSKLENVIFSKNQDGEYDTYLAKYPVSEEEIKTLSTEDFENMETNFQILNKATQYVCITTTIYGGCNETHSNGYTCSGETVTSDCYNMDGGSGGGGSGDSGSGTGSGTGTTWQGGGVSTTPTGGGGGTSLNMDNFYLSLQFNQQEWFDNQSTETQQSIFNYLNTNGFTTTNKNKIKNLIQVVSQTNGTFVLSPDVNSGNSQVFNNSQELTNYLNSITDNQNSTTEFTSLSQNQKIAKFNKTVNFFTDFSVQVSQSISPHIIQSVASSISGNTFSITYTQTTPNNGADISTNNNIVTVQFYGNLDINIFFEGIGVIHTYEITQIVKINKLTGEPIPGSYQIIGLP